MPYSPWCHHCPHCMICPKHGQKLGKQLSGKPYCLKCEEEEEINRKLRNKEYHSKYRKVHSAALSLQAREKNKHRDPEYWIWIGINSRCHNPTSDNYARYGEVGISVCEDWRRLKGRTHKKENAQKYQKFREDIGPRPSPIHTLDRYPNRRGNYEPGNVRWATPKEQANNRKDNLDYRALVSDQEIIFYQDRWMTLLEFNKITGIHLAAIKRRFAYSSNTTYVLNSDVDNRYYEWKGHKYNMAELSLISNLPYNFVHYRIVTKKWDFDRLVGECL